ncbi:MAG: hypothetical protein ABIH00_09925 [Armatimonadota bacterium]
MLNFPVNSAAIKPGAILVSNNTGDYKSQILDKGVTQYFLNPPLIREELITAFIKRK